MKNNKSNISSKSSMGKYRRRGFTACCILILCLCCFTSTAFATSGSIDDDQLRLENLKVGDITEHGIVTAIDENGYFFKIDESEAVVTPMSTFNGSLTGLFDSETTLNDSAFYFGGQAVCKNLATELVPFNLNLVILQLEFPLARAIHSYMYGVTKIYLSNQ